MMILSYKTLSGHSAENDFLLAFVLTDLRPPGKACGERDGFPKHCGEHHALRTGMAEAGLWLWEMQEADFINHSHSHSLTSLSGPGRQEEA